MNPSDYQRIEQAILLLEDHATEQPDLEAVAAQLGLSPCHAQRLFRAWAGLGPKRFLHCLTLEHAKARLRASAPLLDVALKLGLSGPGRQHDLSVNVEAMTPDEYKRCGSAPTLRYAFHPSPFGEALLAVTDRGLCHLAFAGAGQREVALAELRQRWPAAELAHAPGQTAELAERIFDPAVKSNAPLPLLLKGSNFQLKVWQTLLRIPEGAVVSYGALAQAVGQPGASRAVGSAVGNNPVAYLIPCHRVLRASGAIGGYRWGVARKRAMLVREASVALSPA
jgi:AraC family transcriptional regulator of adaptative response/methylated-DNA-[protein]-cysteine methyltransferase